MTGQKIMVRSKYEKYEMLCFRPHVEGTNKIPKTHASVKKKVCLYVRKTQMKRNDTIWSTLLELCLSFLLYV